MNENGRRWKRVEKEREGGGGGRGGRMKQS